MSEAAKIRARILPLLEDQTVLDIGCGLEKVVPWAVGVDDYREYARAFDCADASVDVSASSCALEAYLDGRRFGVVFSSHTLEHLREPVLETLRYWLRFVTPGGCLVLYLPDERRYVYDRNDRTRRNPAHHHYLTMDTFDWFLGQLEGAEVQILEPDFGEDRYSFLVVLRKAVA